MMYDGHPDPVGAAEAAIEDAVTSSRTLDDLRENYEELLIVDHGRQAWNEAVQRFFEGRRAMVDALAAAAYAAGRYAAHADRLTVEASLRLAIVVTVRPVRGEDTSYRHDLAYVTAYRATEKVSEGGDFILPRQHGMTQDDYLSRINRIDRDRMLAAARFLRDGLLTCFGINDDVNLQAG